jgi:hypothetical protein
MRQDCIAVTEESLPITSRGAASMKPWLRYLFALLIGVHGCIYFAFGMGRIPEPFKGWRGTSWLLGSAITGDRLKALTFGLSRVAGIATLTCALAVAFARAPHGLWPPLAMTGAAFSIAVFAVFWDGQTGQLVNQGVIGVAVSAVLFLSAILSPRMFG